MQQPATTTAAAAAATPAAHFAAAAPAAQCFQYTNARLFLVLRCHQDLYYVATVLLASYCRLEHHQELGSSSSSSGVRVRAFKLNQALTNAEVALRLVPGLLTASMHGSEEALQMKEQQLLQLRLLLLLDRHGQAVQLLAVLVHCLHGLRPCKAAAAIAAGAAA
jgi:hypothetical protein